MSSTQCTQTVQHVLYGRVNFTGAHCKTTHTMQSKAICFQVNAIKMAALKGFNPVHLALRDSHRCYQLVCMVALLN